MLDILADYANELRAPSAGMGMIAERKQVNRPAGDARWQQTNVSGNIAVASGMPVMAVMHSNRTPATYSSATEITGSVSE